MPNKTILPPPYLTLEDENGATITNGSVKFLETGTAILAVVYADADGLVVSANPLTVDGAGRYTVFVTPGQVLDLEFYDENGALVHTVNQVQAIPSTSGNVDMNVTFGEAVVYGNVVYLSDGTGGVTAGRWYRANAATGPVGTYAQPSVGIALTTAPAGGSGAVRMAGRATDLAGLIVGQVYYIGDTFGALSLTPGFNARVVGQADTTTTLVLWPNPPMIGAQTADYALSGTIAQLLPPPVQTVRLSNAGLVAILGIKAGYNGQRIRFIGANLGQVDFYDSATGAAAADQLRNWVTSGPTSLAPNCYKGMIEYEYDGVQKFWRLVAHEQGDWIHPAFNAANYGAPAGSTWTVISSNQSNDAYYLRGKVLSWQLTIANSVLTGAAAAVLVRNTPQNYICAGGNTSHILALDNAGNVPMAMVTSTNLAQVSLYPHPSGTLTWTPGGALLIYFNSQFNIV